MKIIDWVYQNRQPRVYDKESPTLRASKCGDLLVLASPKSTSTPSKSMKSNSLGTETMETAQQLSLLPCPSSTLSVQAFLARVSQLLASGEDLKIQEALYSLRSLGLHGLKNRVIYSLRMSKDSCPTMRAIPLRQSSARLMNWGMTVNGKCLTAKTSASPRIGSESSLSDILEAQVDRKYFLSNKTIQKMLAFNQRKINKGHGFRVSIQDMDKGGAAKDISEWAASKETKTKSRAP